MDWLGSHQEIHASEQEQKNTSSLKGPQGPSHEGDWKRIQMLQVLLFVSILEIKSSWSLSLKGGGFFQLKSIGSYVL